MFKLISYRDVTWGRVLQIGPWRFRIEGDTGTTGRSLAIGLTRLNTKREGKGQMIAYIGLWWWQLSIRNWGG